MSRRKLNASILMVGWRSTKLLMGLAVTIITPRRDDHSGNHNRQLVDHADGGDHRIQREDHIQQQDLHENAGERRFDAGGAVPSQRVSLDKWRWTGRHSLV